MRPLRIPWTSVTELVLAKDRAEYVLYAQFKSRDGTTRQYPIEKFGDLVGAVVCAAGYIDQKNKKRAKKLELTVTSDVYEECCQLCTAAEAVERFRLNDLVAVIL